MNPPKFPLIIFSQDNLNYYQTIPQAQQHLDALQNMAPRVSPPALANGSPGDDLDDLDEFEIEVDGDLMADIYEQQLQQATLEQLCQQVMTFYKPRLVQQGAALDTGLP